MLLRGPWKKKINNISILSIKKISVHQVTLTFNNHKDRSSSSSNIVSNPRHIGGSVMKQKL